LFVDSYRKPGAPAGFQGKANCWGKVADRVGGLPAWDAPADILFLFIFLPAQKKIIRSILIVLLNGEKRTAPGS
jgi:hypothetical protein